MFITISTQAGVGTPLIFVMAFAHYNPKRVTETANDNIFISIPPQFYFKHFCLIAKYSKIMPLYFCMIYKTFCH